MKHDITTEETKHFVNQTDSKNYLVHGRLIGHVSNCARNASKRVYKLYRSNQGKYVAQREENYETHVSVFEKEALVINFFKYSDLAKELYDQANIPHLMIID